jgi:hypothetical protein
MVQLVHPFLVSDDSRSDSSVSPVSDQPRRSRASSASRGVPSVVISEHSVGPVDSVPYLQYCVARTSGALLGPVVRYYPTSHRCRSALSHDAYGQLRLDTQYTGAVPPALAQILRSSGHQLMFMLCITCVEIL